MQNCVVAVPTKLILLWEGVIKFEHKAISTGGVQKRAKMRGGQPGSNKMA